MSKPNIVVLLLDAARADHVSTYGYERDTTPFIDHLAADGTKYDMTYANSIWSLPSYASIFTGEYPTNHGANDWNKSVDNNSLIEGLQERGYETAAVSTHLITGEFGLANAFDQHNTVALTPDDRLFADDPVGQQLAEHGTAEGWSSEREKYAVFLKLLLNNPSGKSLLNGAYALYNKLKRKAGIWGDDGGQQVVDQCRTVIDTIEEPFFLFGNFVETHDPYRPPRAVRDKFLPSDASLSEVREAVKYSSVRASLGLEKMSDRRREILCGLYDAEIAYVDGLVKEIYKAIEQRGIADNTVVVVLSDHGDFFGEHGLWGHQGGIYDPVSRVPLIVTSPWETGEPESGPYELRGLHDYLLDVADGNRGTMPSPREALVEYYGLDTQLSFIPWEKYDGIDPDRWGTYECSYTDGEYQLVWRADGTVELFESNDMSQQDVATDNPDVVTELQSRVVDLVGEPSSNHSAYRSRQRTDGLNVSDDVHDRLEQLGYTE